MTDEPQRRWKRWHKITLGTVAMLLVFFLGVAAGSSPAPADAEAGDAVTVTETVTEVVEHIETIESTETIQRAPEQCARAIRLANEGFELAGALFGAIGAFDVARIEAAASDLEEWMENDRDAYILNGAVCIASSEQD